MNKVNKMKRLIKTLLREEFVNEARFTSDIYEFLDQDPKRMTTGTAYYISSMDSYMNKFMVDEFGNKVPNPMYGKIFKHTRFIFGWKDTFERAAKRINPNYVSGERFGDYKPVEGYDMLESGKSGLYFPIIPTGTEYVYVICDGACRVADKNEVKKYLRPSDGSNWVNDGKPAYRQLIVDRAVKITGGGHEWVNDKLKSKWLGIGNI
jgi:hypothetical protein